jgi:hypothetical protein
MDERIKIDDTLKIYEKEAQLPEPTIECFY